MKIRNKFILIFVVIFLIPLIVVSLYYQNNSGKMLNEILKTQVKSNSTTLLNQADKNINKYKEDLTLFSESALFKNLSNAERSNMMENERIIAFSLFIIWY